MNGTQILFTVESAVPDTYTAIASTRNWSWSESAEVVDESSKDQDYFVGSPGRRTMTIEASGLYDPADAGFIRLLAQLRAGGTVTMERSEDADVSQIENIDGVVTDITVDAPDQAEAVWSLSVQCISDWTAAA